jgi:translin
LQSIAREVQARLAARNAAREAGLAACRTLIRLSANSIRAIHRGEFDTASSLLAEARAVHDSAVDSMRGHPDVYHAGFLHDAQKEYVEASATLALLHDEAIPTPESLEVEDAAYLNGIAEAIGEMRRWILDRLRAGQDEGCEAALAAMDEIYAVLVTIDYPDAMTGGLRRTTDQARGILEKTRGDLTMAIVQRDAAARFGGPHAPTNA